ncbi:MAG: inositol monophosphatase family protein [Micavibrio sp.]
MQDLLSLANHLADESGAVIRRYFRTVFTTETKEDASPVTIADREAEARIRQIIEATRPDDAILGEEYGHKEGKSGFTWVLDPIDGTKSFVVGRPSFGTLIALCKNGTPILGIIDQPVIRERWASDSKSTTFNGTRVFTRKATSLKECRIASTAPAQLAPPNTQDYLWQTLDTNCSYTLWGGDCYSYGLLANGGLDAVIETCLSPHDYLALVPVIKGAGGWMGDWGGGALMLESHNKSGQTLALGNPAMKDRFIDLLK